MKAIVLLRHSFFQRAGFFTLALALALLGCEGSKDDPTGTENYLNNNPYSSEERPDPLVTALLITPLVAAINIVGQEVIFTAKGGEGSYHWYLANEENGELSFHGANQASYKCKKIGNNSVIVQDDGGHFASAQVTPGADAMSLTPSTVTLSGGARYVAFTVTGGTPPYSWTVGNASLGIISYSAATSYTAGYTAVVGVYGQNIVTVRDSEGRIIAASVTQSP